MVIRLDNVRSGFGLLFGAGVLFWHDAYLINHIGIAFIAGVEVNLLTILEPPEITEDGAIDVIVRTQHNVPVDAGNRTILMPAGSVAHIFPFAIGDAIATNLALPAFPLNGGFQIDGRNLQ